MDTRANQYSEVKHCSRYQQNGQQLIHVDPLCLHQLFHHLTEEEAGQRQRGGGMSSLAGPGKHSHIRMGGGNSDAPSEEVGCVLSLRTAASRAGILLVAMDYLYLGGQERCRMMSITWQTL